MGYRFQFITLAGIHSMWFSMFDLAHAYAQGEGMRHYVEKVQQPEFAARDKGYTFSSHQQEVGTGYFDRITTGDSGRRIFCDGPDRLNGNRAVLIGSAREAPLLCSGSWPPRTGDN